MSNIRCRYRELAEHLKTKAIKLGIPTENFQSEITRMELGEGGHNETIEGWHLANFRYHSVILIKRISIMAATRLMLHCRIWLNEHDDNRKRYSLPTPQVCLEVSNIDGLLDVSLNIEFVDPIYITESENGDIDWNGRTYEIGDYDLRVAESGKINGAVIE